MRSLIARFKRQQEPFEELLDPHMEHLFCLAYRFTNNQSDAEDLVQDLLVKLYPKFEQICEIESLKAWLSRSLYNLFVDQYRKSSRLNEITQSCEQDELVNMEDHRHGPEQETGLDRIGVQLQVALDKLSEDHRILVMMHDVEGYSLPELEEMFGTPIGTLKSRLHRARGRLRDLIDMEPNEADLRLGLQRNP